MNQTIKIENNRLIAIDGLRGVAILMVMILHFYNEAIINNAYPIIGPVITKLALSGLYGVELFFVLSGFLITQSLLDTKITPHYFRNFYIRRLLRILPLYYTVLFLIFFILPFFIAFDDAANDISSRQMWLWTFLLNAPFSGGGWDSSSIFRLGHLWFLCVVVHFYVIWPFFIYKFDTRTIIYICITGMVLLFLIRLFHTVIGAPEIFTWSSIRKLDGLIWGSFLAAGLRIESVSCLIKKYAPRTLWITGLFFLMLIFIPRRYMQDSTGHTGYYWTFIETVSVLFFGCLLFLQLHRSGVQKIIKNELLLSLGKYSYGLFVIHNLCLPLFQWLFKPTSLANIINSALAAQLIFYTLSITASFILAFISWHLYEKHFLRLKELF